MKKITLIFLIVILIVVVITLLSYFLSSFSTNYEENKSNNKSNPELANPASVFCLEHNGIIEMRQNENGQYGVCIFNDSSECDEWQYYREECKPGESLAK